MIHRTCNHRLQLIEHGNRSTGGICILSQFMKMELRQYFSQVISQTITNEPHRDKTNKMACPPREGSDQLGVHPV